ncbi:MAG: hypothetical protein LC791_10290 [Acidobacteria bacterium]|nr:hypothetical protein [Acidobacteriota bacterium]
MEPSSWRPSSTPDPRAQGDGTPEPVYTVEATEAAIHVRVAVRCAPTQATADELETVEVGYGHGV